MTAPSAKTLARLAFSIREDRTTEFEAAYECTLAPILAKHGLTPSSERGRPTAESVFSRLFEIDSVSALSAASAALSSDAAWNSALESLTPEFAPNPAQLFAYRLIVYSAPAGSGRTAMGRGRGKFREYGNAQLRRPLYEDRDGCLWCGHAEGVGRFDGQEWTVYTPKDGLVHPDVQVISQDGVGRMWFGAHHSFVGSGTRGGGLSCFDGETFTNYMVADGLPHDKVTGITTLTGTSIMVATHGGVALYDGSRFGRTFTVVDGLPSNRIQCVTDAHGFWFGTDRGASFWDGSQFTNYSTADGLASDDVQSIMSDGQTIWALGRDSLSRFDGGRWTVVEADFLRDAAHVMGSTVDQSGAVWVATSNGLFRYDGEHWTHFDEREGYNVAWDVFADSSGRIWATTANGSLLRYEGDPWITFAEQDGLAAGFGARCISGGKDDALWIGTAGGGGGVSRYNGESWTTFRPEDGLVGENVWSLLVDREDRLWISTFEGLSCFDGHRFDNFTTDDGLPNQMVIASCEDDDGNLWFGTMGGACRYDGEAWTTYHTTDGLANDRVRCILQDRHGQMWFGTAGGVTRFDGNNWRSFYREDGLAGDRVQSLIEDNEGNIWAASWGGARPSSSDPRGGLSRFDGERWTSYSVEDGLPSNNCSTVFQDGAGHIWVGTHGDGVGRFDGQTFQTIDRRDGLGGEVVWAIHEDVDGCYWFASEGGATRYTPQPASQMVPPVVVIDAVIADRRYEAAAELELPASTSIVVFEFHGESERTRADGLAYRHRLQGQEEDWRTAKEGRVEFTGVTPGDYTFQVQAVDKEMTYSETAEMRLAVRNPLQERVDELEERVRERTVELEDKNSALEDANKKLEEFNVMLAAANLQIQEASRHKSDFLARMSHDLRTPMNAIIGYTRILLRRSKDALEERQYRNLENIQTSADNLLGLINDILDLSKIEAGRVDVNPQEVDLRPLVEECSRSVEALLNPSVSLVQHLDSTVAIHTDPNLLRRVLMNLLGNAVKFTEQGTITVTVQDSEDVLQLSVADTGVGIPADDLPKVFEEFHQLEQRSGQQQGSGLGLAIAQKTVELLGGTIRVESEIGRGTTFTVELPR